MKTTLLVLAAFALAASAPTFAQNKGGGAGSAVGVITIDQAKAEAGGITAGDTPGFPVTLSQPGSYRLMSNLTVADMAVTAIRITSAGVTLDLNGFEVSGPNSCTGSGGTLACLSYNLPANSTRGIGILVTAPSVAVHGGSVRGFAANGIQGIDAGAASLTIDRVRASHSGWVGITHAALVTGSVAHHNGTNGMASVMSAIGNAASANRSSGIVASGLRHHVSAGNGSADAMNTLIE
jgi:hypothetical protein